MKQAFKECYQDYYKSYNECLSLWPVSYTTLDVSTTFGETHVIRSGSTDKPPLILLHGMGFSSTMWYPNIAGLSSEFSIYCIDIIGDTNRSVCNRKPANRAELARWLLEVINALQIEKPSIAGLSYGGFITLNFAYHYPEYVNKVILLCPAATIKPFKLQFFIRIFSLMLFSKGKVLQSFMDWMFGGRYEVNPLFLQQFEAGVKLRRSSKADRSKSHSKSIWPTVFTNVELQEIKMSVLLLVGDKEEIYNPRKVIARAKKWIPRIQTHLIPNVGHGMSMEQPEITNNYIINFISNT
ncbi:pimeloyl-ACP methyl ester carboxylesterase [Paenibacillus forsythiae]|uniref:Pimeloyl-ACP methyl ester carboxylesterase n=1 Tax=Paenibacillus forsythiae TaxID=365616 RepID=A0ABU3HEI6_9BACL|nr:alpha/beta hydrolase [Paenibacillus forsythiae]MDT3429236.1 pimeloyl-ACP methyl ester carboxylesterase [Paenibacillus forsythiae]